MATIQDKKQDKTQKLIEGEKALRIGFYVLLIGAAALIGIGTPLHAVFMILGGFTVLLSSPIFLVAAIALKRKIKKLGI